MDFKIDNKIKHEFLDTKPASTANTDAFTLRATDNYEDLIKKPIYNMTEKELREMLITQFKNTSVKTIIKNASVLKNYVDFCMTKNLSIYGENRLTSFTKEFAKQIVNRQALLKKYITKEKIIEYQDILYNKQDKLLIGLPFIGCRGRTTKEGSLEEIINLSMDNVDEVNNMITLVQNNGNQRMLKVDTSIIALIKETYEQKFYIENNGEETKNTRLSKPREIKGQHCLWPPCCYTKFF